MPLRRKSDTQEGPDKQAEMLAVNTIDLLAQVEGLLREVTELQRQALRLREIGTAGKKEALTLIAGQVKALLAHADT